MGTEVVVALVAGGLAPINPCGFSLLPAFLSLQFADDDPLGRDRLRVLRGVQVGGTVALGFIGVFVAAGLPLALGASFFTRYVAWGGAATGLVLIAAGLWVLTGHRLGLSTRGRPSGPGRKSLLSFGIGYGTASLGCTLPVFLAVVGVSAASGNLAAVLITFAAYAIGTLSTLVVLGVAASSARDWVAARMKRLIPHMRSVSGVLLLVAGSYLSYYWFRIAIVGIEEANSDPVTRAVGAATAATERFAAAYGRPLVAAVLVLVGAMAFSALRARRRSV